MPGPQPSSDDNVVQQVQHCGGADADLGERLLDRPEPLRARCGQIRSFEVSEFDESRDEGSDRLVETVCGCSIGQEAATLALSRTPEWASVQRKRAVRPSTTN